MLNLSCSSNSSSGQQQQKYRDQIDLLILGSQLAHLFSPIDPLDPIEHEKLVEKSRTDETVLKQHQEMIGQQNSAKLEHIEWNDDSTAAMDYSDYKDKEYIRRENQRDYFRIKYEIENGLKQICSLKQLNKLLNNFCATTTSTTATSKQVDEEYKTWAISLDRLVDKLMSTNWSFNDVICLSVNGLCLIGYAMNSIYTDWQCGGGIVVSESQQQKHNSNNKNDVASLVNVLFNYPIGILNVGGYVKVAEKIYEHTRVVCGKERQHLNAFTNTGT